MAIPESQLQTWSNQGAIASASALYERIRAALQADAALSARTFEVFLQGSYRNSTNIRGDSDVDVVVKLNDTYMPDYTLLDTYTRSIVEGRASSATYTLSDVVPCLEYRLYRPPQGLLADATDDDGIWLWDVQRNHAVTSFPRQSYENGVTKHLLTSEMYKPTVRIFKNARGWMEDNRLIQSAMASSHAIECLLYNVPAQQFGGGYGDTFVAALNWLNSADLSNFMCQNGIQRLFDQGRWTSQNARTYVTALVQMWNQWGQQYARVRI